MKQKLPKQIYCIANPGFANEVQVILNPLQEDNGTVVGTYQLVETQKVKVTRKLKSAK